MRTRMFLALLLISFLPTRPAQNRPRAQASPQAVPAPVLKWEGKGCYPWGCESGWYSSPAVADLDGDGAPEVIGAAYSIVILDGASGALHRRIEPGAGRQWPSLVVADLQGNGSLEIVTAHGDGSLRVFNQAGDLLWSQQPTPGIELRSLATYDLEGDGDLEIIVASTRSANQWFVFEDDRSRRSGNWPQHYPDSDTNGFTAGCYNENVAAGDLDGDGRAEIVGPNDTHYLAAFHDDGAQVLANPIYDTNHNGGQDPWSRVGVHVDHAVDLRGFADCGSEHRPNFAHSAPIVVDVDNNGVNEAVVVGNIYNCGADPYQSLYEMPYILNGDRTRWHAGAYDWTVLPVPDGQAAPLSEDYDQIENNQPNPAAADLDGDGFKEILYPSYDGRLHAYWLDKTEHGSWPYSVNQPGEGFYRFASEPVIADLDNDGHAEVIFASWTEKGSGHTGRLHILDYLGNPLHEVPLPAAYGGESWNGALAAPTLANIDADADLEVVLNTANSGLVAYDLPGSAGARILWGTGRGSFQRSGSLVVGNLLASTKTASRSTAAPDDTLTYTIRLTNPGPLIPAASVTDTLPAGVTFAGGLSASSGSVQENAGVITWQGAVSPGSPVTIRFDARIDAGITQPRLLLNTALIDDGLGGVIQRQALTIVNPQVVLLPLVGK